MGSLTCLADPEVPVVADTSAVINLNATGCGAAILQALPNRLLVVNTVSTELLDGQRPGRCDAALLDEVVAAGLASLVQLGDRAYQHFGALVAGPAMDTLDDGEAATIAYAAEHGALAIVDERKATRICAERLPDLRTGCTVDMLCHPDVGAALGRSNLSDAVFHALRDGRMRVFPRHAEWVVGVIGNERAALCTSLPRSIRARQRVATDG